MEQWKLIRPPADWGAAIASCLADVVPRFDVQMREYAYLRNAEFLRDRGVEMGPASHDGLTPRQVGLWREHARAIAAELRRVPGAVDVVADPIRGKGYLEIRADRARAGRLGVAIGDLTDAIETAIGGRVATTTVEGRERHAVRVRYARAFREDEASAREILVPTLRRDPDGRPRFVRMGEVADVRIVEGPATIKGENGALRTTSASTSGAGAWSTSWRRPERLGRGSPSPPASRSPGRASSSTRPGPGGRWPSSSRWSSA